MSFKNMNELYLIIPLWPTLKVVCGLYLGDHKVQTTRTRIMTKLKKPMVVR